MSGFKSHQFFHCIVSDIIAFNCFFCQQDSSAIPTTVTSECLAAMAHICRGLLSKPDLRGRVTRADTLMLCLRVMTGVIILYDHVDPSGVFRKTSKLDVSLANVVTMFYATSIISASYFKDKIYSVYKEVVKTSRNV